MVVSTELAPDKWLEELLWDYAAGEQKPWNVIIRPSSTPPPSSWCYESLDFSIPSSEDSNCSVRSFFGIKFLRAEIERLLHNDPQKIIEVTLHESNRVYVYVPPSS